MRILAVDDEEIALKNLELKIKECHQVSQVTSYTSPMHALAWMKEHPADVALLDISMRKMNGLALAKEIKDLQPQCAIVFVTGYAEYAVKAFALKASGYLVKPVDTEDLQRELDYVCCAQHEGMQKNDTRLKVQCFGNFEVFDGDKPLVFGRSKTKELFAYLIDRRGASVTGGELCAVLWEDKENTPALGGYLRQLILDLTTTLHHVDKSTILVKGRNRYAVDVELVNCDMYRFLERDPVAVNAYRGEYMTQYHWAEMTLSNLEQTL